MNRLANTCPRGTRAGESVDSPFYQPCATLPEMEAQLRDTVIAASGGSRKAIAVLMGHQLPALQAFLRVRMGPGLSARESAEDLAQSVCREMLQDLDQFEYRGEEAFRKWLFQQAARKLIDKSRYWNRQRRAIAREQRAPTRDDAESLLAQYGTMCTPTRALAAKEEVARIEQAIDALPEHERDAVALSRLAGLPYREIAAIMERSESAVRGLTARGLARLARVLQQPDE